MASQLHYASSSHVWHNPGRSNGEGADLQWQQSFVDARWCNYNEQYRGPPNFVLVSLGGLVLLINICT